MVDHQRPHHIAVAEDDGVRAATFMRFVGIQRRVYAAEDHRRPARSRRGTNFIAAQCISRVDPNPDDVAGADGVEIERLERLVDDAWPSVCRWSSRAQNEQPARRDHAHAEGQMAGVHQVDGHSTPQQAGSGVALTTAVDIVTLLHGSSSAPEGSEAEATSPWRGASLAGKCSLQYIPGGQPDSSRDRARTLQVEVIWIQWKHRQGRPLPRH
jgi:hypothetical protein